MNQVMIFFKIHLIFVIHLFQFYVLIPLTTFILINFINYLIIHLIIINIYLFILIHFNIPIINYHILNLNYYNWIMFYLIHLYINQFIILIQVIYELP